MSRLLKTIATIFAAIVVVSSAIISPVQAITKPKDCNVLVDDVCMDDYYVSQGIGHYDPTFCTGGSGGSNKDYAGKTIVTTAQLDGIKRNQSVYEKAAEVAKIPWQMIAVIHLRETNLSRINPTNGQGLFQDAAKLNGPYPSTGAEVTDEEFLRQATWAGTFLRDKATTPSLLVNGNEDQVKDAFFGYNGRAAVYKTQATSLGFSSAADGSPYVMNKADKVRDPEAHKTDNTWGQIKEDGGPLVFPANSDYGAFVVYGAIKGSSGSSAECSAAVGEFRQKIVKFAEAELAKWEGDTTDPDHMSPGFMKDSDSSFSKYSNNIADDWCAWFVSWILKQAGNPVDAGGDQTWSMVDDFVNKGPSEENYKVHENDETYKPKVGDLAVYDGGGRTNTHINIIVGYSDDGQIITIGGNQGAPEGGDYTTSRVSRNIGYGEQAARYISVD